MKRALCSAVVMTALLTSGCEGIRLKTTNINVECTGSPRDTAGTASPDSDKDVKNPNEIPEMGPKKRTGQEKLSTRNLPEQDNPGPASQTRFVLPVEYFTDTSCPTHDREVEAIPQFTGVWCWAASAEAVMKFHDSRMNTSQCNIVNTVFNSGNPADSDVNAFCCDNNNRREGICQQNGLPDSALTAFQFEYSKWKLDRWGPLPPKKIRGQICQNGPFIFVLHYAGGGGHSFVVGDFEDIDGEFYVWIHDHSYEMDANNEPTPTPFQRWSYDAYVKGRWEGETHRHSIDYVQIYPPQ